jgi:AraC-like DNA-binding protein
MHVLRPIYKESGRIYRPDKCLPLIAAQKAGEIQLEAWARLGYPGKGMPDEVLPGVNSVGFWNAQFQQDWGLPWHRNEGIEITFLETGTMPFSVGEKEYTIMPNEFTVTRPWQPHKLGNPSIGIGKFYWIILDVGVRQPHQEWVWPSWIMLTKPDLDDLTKILRQNEQPIWKVNQDIRKCFSKIGELIQGDDSFSKESWLVIYINELLMQFLQSFRSGGFKLDKSLTDSTRTIELFLTHLDENYFKVWTLESMAEHCGLGTTRFVHYFKLATNMTPMHYLNFIRLKAAAKQLILDPFTQISLICYEHGFSSGQYFSTLFRKQYGCSPADYRSRTLKIQNLKEQYS